MMYLIKNKLCFEKFVFFKIYLNGNKQYAMHCGQNTTLSQALSGMCSLTEKGQRCQRRSLWRYLRYKILLLRYCDDLLCI